MKRIVAVPLLLTLLTSSPVAFADVQVGSADSRAVPSAHTGKGPGTTVLSTQNELLQATGLSGTVLVRGFEDVNDGISVTYTVNESRPDGALGELSVPLRDGQWATPVSIPTASALPATGSNAAADIIARAESFVAAGKDLEWQGDVDGAVSPPTTNNVVHQIQQKPYAVTCGVFVTMILAGWDYQHTTYVADANTRQHTWVDLGKPVTDVGLGQANRVARFFYQRGQLWAPKNVRGEIRPGDILFFSKQDPEGPLTGGKYFGNVYHAALYVGNGQVVHSYGHESEGGVVRQGLRSDALKDVLLVARPEWKSDLPELGEDPGDANWAFAKAEGAFLNPSIKPGTPYRAHPGVWDPVPASIEYQWYLDGEPIIDATTATFTPSLGHVGHRLKVRTVGYLEGYQTTTSFSAEQVVKAEYTYTPKPLIGGKVVAGNTVRGYPGSWNPMAESFKYQWQIDDQPVAGATERDFYIKTEHEGRRLSLTVTAVAKGMPEVSTTSNETTVPVGGSGNSVPVPSTSPTSSAPNPNIGTTVPAWHSTAAGWKYYDRGGVLRHGWFKVKGTWYWADKDGVAVGGWRSIGGSWFFFDHTSKAMKTGWLKDGGYWYYLKESGHMATGWLKLGQHWFYLHNFGGMATGWLKNGGYWYYLHPSGHMATGWIKVNGVDYYLYGFGGMAVGRVDIGGRYSNFADSGKWLGYAH